MQKFILIRGHQGAGKSTFARQQIAAFECDYPHGEVVYIENDRLLTDADGVYRWSPDALEKAQRQGMAQMKAALKRGQAQPQADILIVNANTNQKAAACHHWLQLARKHGFATEIYRLHNFYPNLHGVAEADVLAAYLKLNHNRLRDEIHLEPERPISAEQTAQLARMESFGQQPLPFDQTQQTHVTAEYLAIGSRHFTQKPSRRYPQLRVLKYTRNVFYNNRFDDALLEMRGLVLDEHQRIIVRPFKKVFNYSERTAANSRYPIRMHDDMLVDAVVKVNGFLGCATYVDLADDHPSRGAAFERQVLYSTTGSLDSDFAQLAAKHCAPYEALFRQYPNHTFLFEITDPGDVHIIREPFGATLIGLIEVASGRAFREAELDELAAAFNAEHAAAGLQLIRPQTLRRIRFGDLKQQLKSVQHEGFMVFDAESQALLFKLKSPYYLISKFFGRSNANNLGRKLDKRHVDEEYYPLLDHLRQHRQTFNAMGEQEKIAFIQAFLRGV